MKILDSIDKRILSILQVDGRITNVDLASRVHLSPTPCLDRVRRLERDQYILGYRAQLNPTLLNCDFVILMAVILNAGIILQTKGINTNTVLALTGLILFLTAIGDELSHYRIVRTPAAQAA